MKKLIFLFIVIVVNTVFATNYQTISWNDLMPETWHPQDIMDEIFSGIDLNSISEDEEFSGNNKKFNSAMLKFRKAMDEAPVEKTMKGKSIKIAGYIAILEYNTNKKINEFFLVPYFGACIHSPAPPANQIIYVISKNGISTELAEDAVWASGILDTQIVKKNDIGIAGYTMTLDKIESY
jgi:hypothetical protein